MPKTVEDFVAAFDAKEQYSARIKAALDKLEGWEYEIDFCKGNRLSLQLITKHREQFKEYIVSVPAPGRSISRMRHIWCDSAKLANQLRKRVEAVQ